MMLMSKDVFRIFTLYQLFCHCTATSFVFKETPGIVYGCKGNEVALTWRYNQIPNSTVINLYNESYSTDHGIIHCWDVNIKNCDIYLKDKVKVISISQTLVELQISDVTINDKGRYDLELSPPVTASDTATLLVLSETFSADIYIQNKAVNPNTLYKSLKNCEDISVSVKTHHNIQGDITFYDGNYLVHRCVKVITCVYVHKPRHEEIRLDVQVDYENCDPFKSFVVISGNDEYACPSRDVEVEDGIHYGVILVIIIIGLSVALYLTLKRLRHQQGGNNQDEGKKSEEETLMNQGTPVQRMPTGKDEAENKDTSQELTNQQQVNKESSSENQRTDKLLLPVHGHTGENATGGPGIGNSECDVFRDLKIQETEPETVTSVGRAPLPISHCDDNGDVVSTNLVILDGKTILLNPIRKPAVLIPIITKYDTVI